MKDEVSQETARALYDAGFPKNTHIGFKRFVLDSPDTGVVGGVNIVKDGEVRVEDISPLTTIDILRELPDDEWSLEYYKKHDVWNVHRHIRYDGDRHLPHSYPHALIDPAKQGYKNPAEAAAAFWLSLKLKK